MCGGKIMINNHTKGSSLTIDDLYFIYENATDFFVAIKGISLQFRAGEISLLMGSSGSGKTTLLNLINGSLQPTSGTITYRNSTSSTNPKIALLDQFSYSLFRYGNSVNETLKLFSRNLDNSFNISLNTLNMAMSKHTPISKLSFGEAQRLALLVCLQNDPEIILLDEPTAQLDKENTEEIISTLKKLKKHNKMIILATHDLRLVPFCDRIFNLSEGFIDSVHHEKEKSEIIFRVPSIAGGAVKIPSYILDYWDYPTHLIYKFDVETKLVTLLSSNDNKIHIPFKFPWDYFERLEQQPWLECSNVSINTPDDRKLPVPNELILSGGSIICFIGPSGSGKTTFIRFISKTLNRNFRTSGKIIYSDYQENNIGFVLQHDPYLAQLTVIEHVYWILDSDKKINIFHKILKYFGVSFDLTRQFSKYSGGQKYIMALAIMLAQKPSIFILDETLANFDKQIKDKVLDIFYKLSELNHLIIISTHDMKVAEIATSKIFFK